MNQESKMQYLHPKAIWLFFFRYAASFIIAALVLGGWIGGAIGSEFGKGFGFIAGIALIVILLFIVISYIWARLSWHFWRYQLTEDSYRAERGVIFKRYISIPYERIQNIDIYRGILDRILGLSDLQIQTAGYGAAGGYSGRGFKGFGSEGRLPGLDKYTAEKLRDEFIKRAKGNKSGL